MAIDTGSDQPAGPRCPNCGTPYESGSTFCGNCGASLSGGSATGTLAGADGDAVRFDVQYPEELSRWLIFVKWLLAIPHFLILYALGIVAGIVVFIAFFAILFTKQFPRGLFDFAVNIHRWNENVVSYISLMRDEYPPFAWDPGIYPVTYEVDYPQELNRWLPLVKWLLVIPHLIVLLVLYFAASVVVFIAFFAILFTKQFPRGMFDFVVAVMRWWNRVYAYMYLMRDEYPPFSLK
jgi:hypothetical protein